MAIFHDGKWRKVDMGAIISLCGAVLCHKEWHDVDRRERAQMLYEKQNIETKRSD